MDNINYNEIRGTYSFYSLKELSFKFNIDKRTLDSRLRNGWDLEKALNTPVRKRSVK